MNDVMDLVRYFLATLLVVGFIPVLALWPLIHGFIGLWRRWGRVKSYLLLLTPALLAGIAVFRHRDLFLAGDLGTRTYLWPIALLAYGTAVVIEVRCRRHLSLQILVGLPELSSDRSQDKLLTEGIYANMRHPRYVGILLGFTAFALFVNYLTVYLVLAALIPIGYLTVFMEEEELRERFGAEYERYCEQVPRFVPSRQSPLRPHSETSPRS